jgi:aminotransferase
MSLISGVVDDLAPSGIREFFDLVMGMDDVISLGVGEPDFDTPQHIKEAMIQAIESGYNNYTSNQGMMELRETIADFVEDNHGVRYDPETEILITVGVSEAMDLAMRAMINPGDEVIVPTPSYVSYSPTAKMAGGDVVTLETTQDNNFRIQPDQLRDHLTEGTKILVLNYPANPTGVTYSKEDLLELTDVLADRDVTVFSDEVYGQLTYEGSHTALPGLPGMRDKTLYLNGFSKAYAMTGHRIAYACGPEPIISAMTKIHQYTMLCVPTASQFAGIEALKNGEAAVESMKKQYESRRDLVIQRLNEMGLTCARPSGAFYAFPSVAATGQSPDEFCRGLLEEKKVAAVPGSAFGPGGENNIRLSYATGMDQLKMALDRMEEYVDQHTAMTSSGGSIAS